MPHQASGGLICCCACVLWALPIAIPPCASLLRCAAKISHAQPITRQARHVAPCLPCRSSAVRAQRRTIIAVGRLSAPRALSGKAVAPMFGRNVPQPPCAYAARLRCRPNGREKKRPFGRPSRQRAADEKPWNKEKNP